MANFKVVCSVVLGNTTTVTFHAFRSNTIWVRSAIKTTSSQLFIDNWDGICIPLFHSLKLEIVKFHHHLHWSWFNSSFHDPNRWHWWSWWLWWLRRVWDRISWYWVVDFFNLTCWLSIWGLLFEPNFVFILVVKVCLRSSSLALSICRGIESLNKGKWNLFCLFFLEVCPIKGYLSIICTHFIIIHGTLFFKKRKLIHINIITSCSTDCSNSHSLCFFI